VYELVARLAAALQSVVPKGIAGVVGTGDGSNSGDGASPGAAAAAAAATAVKKPPPPAPSPKLYWGNLLSQTSAQANVSLKGLVFSVGRGSRCQLQLRDPSVSCIVLRMSPLRGRVVVESHSNSTLTTIDAKPLAKGSRVWLADGSEVAITTASGRAYTYIFQNLLPPAEAGDAVVAPDGGEAVAATPTVATAKAADAATALAATAAAVTGLPSPAPGGAAPPVVGVSATSSAPGPPLSAGTGVPAAAAVVAPAGAAKAPPAPPASVVATPELSPDGKFINLRLPLAGAAVKALKGAGVPHSWAALLGDATGGVRPPPTREAAAAPGTAAGAAPGGGATSTNSTQVAAAGADADTVAASAAAAAAATAAVVTAASVPPDTDTAELRKASEALTAELSATDADMPQSGGVVRLLELVQTLVKEQRAVVSGAPSPRSGESSGTKAAAVGKQTPPTGKGAVIGAPAEAEAVDKETAVVTDTTSDAMAVDTPVVAKEPSSAAAAAVAAGTASPSTPAAATAPVGGETPTHEPPAQADPRPTPGVVDAVVGTPTQSARADAVGSAPAVDTDDAALMLGVSPPASRTVDGATAVVSGDKAKPPAVAATTEDATLTADVRAAGKELFVKSLVAGTDDPPVTLAAFPYSHLSLDLRDVLVHTAYVHLHHPETAERVSERLSTFRPRMLLVGPPGTETYQEKLVRALANHLGAALAVVDLAALASASSTADVAGGGGAAATEVVEPLDDPLKVAVTPGETDNVSEERSASACAAGLDDDDGMDVDARGATAAAEDTDKARDSGTVKGDAKPSDTAPAKDVTAPSGDKDADVVMDAAAAAAVDGAAAPGEAPASPRPPTPPPPSASSAPAPKAAEADAKAPPSAVTTAAAPASVPASQAPPPSAPMPSRAKPPVPPTAAPASAGLDVSGSSAKAATGAAAALNVSAANKQSVPGEGEAPAAVPAPAADTKQKEPVAVAASAAAAVAAAVKAAAELARSHKVNWAVPLDSEIPADAKAARGRGGDRGVFEVGDRVRFIGLASGSVLARGPSSLAYKRAERRLRNRHAATSARRGGDSSPLPLLPPMPFLPPSLGDSAAGRPFIDDELQRALFLTGSSAAPGFLRPRSSVRVVGIGNLSGSGSPGGPAPGAVGQVVLTFSGNTRVGVRFDSPIARGSNLGNRCEGTHGYFCMSTDLEPEVAGAPGDPTRTVPVSSISLLDAIVEAADASLAAPDARPLILYVRDAEQLVAGGDEADTMASRLHAALAKLPPRVLVIGSMTSTDAVRSAAAGSGRPSGSGAAFGDLSRPSALAGLFFPRAGGSGGVGGGVGGAGGRGDLSGMFNFNVLEQLTRMEERMDRGTVAGGTAAGAGGAAGAPAAAAVPASVALFPVRVPIIPPLDEEKATAWRAEIDKDIAAGKRKVNQARLVEVLTSVRMECAGLDAIADGDISAETLSTDAAERIVAFAASIQLKSNDLRAKREARRRRRAEAAGAMPAATTKDAADGEGPTTVSAATETPTSVAADASTSATPAVDASTSTTPAVAASSAPDVAASTDSPLDEVPLEPELVRRAAEAASAKAELVHTATATGDKAPAPTGEDAAAGVVMMDDTPSDARASDEAAVQPGREPASDVPKDAPQPDAGAPAVPSAKDAEEVKEADKAAAPGPPLLLLTAEALAKGIRLFKSDHPEADKTGRAASLRNVTTDNDFEKRLLSDVVPADELGVTFESIGALDKIKETLHEIVMLPLQRPELFRRGNLAKPTKGVLLFGPPGTGKTMLAKAVATEAGANFMNVSLSSVASKWFGEGEKFVKAVFSLARKIAPSVIFIDEVDSMLGKRGEKRSEHEATRKMKNEFMSSWDGLRTKDSERVLVLAATNRPFDLDDAVLRRMPRRLLVDLPDSANRGKILRVITRDEELGPDVDLDELSTLLHGYSGSDLRNLCIAAAYNPIRELLKAEKSGKAPKGAAAAAVKAKAAAAATGNVGAVVDGAAAAAVTADTDADKVVIDADAPTPTVAAPVAPVDGYADSEDSSDEEDPLSAVVLVPEDVPTPTIRPLSQADFLKAKEEVSSSVSEDAISIAELRKWGEEYGDGFGNGTKSKALTYFL